VNTDGQIADLPRDTFFKQGAGGHVLWIVPSLDLVVWRLAGRDDQYDEANTGFALTAEIIKAGESRKDWKSTISRASSEQQIIEKIIESVAPASQSEEFKK
jgi:CubicO group peptidase (beta-lactamase class C family)